MPPPTITTSPVKEVQRAGWSWASLRGDREVPMVIANTLESEGLYLALWTYARREIKVSR
jgi:hypothetical protein